MNRRISERLKQVGADCSARLLATVLNLGGPHAYRDAINALWERQPVSSERDIRLVVPSPVDPDPEDERLVQRIFEAFGKAKVEESKQDPIYLVAGGWKNVVETAYADLIRGWRTNDLAVFHRFLANFGSSHVATGVEQSACFVKATRSPSKQRYLEQYTMARLIQWWETYESQGRELASLSLPPVGNFAGLLVDGHLILPNAVMSDFYSRLLAGFLQKEEPLIAELGGGYGRLCYFLTRQRPTSRYLAFDLPEGLCLASYFLMKAFPERKFLLFGEEDWQHADFDLALLPAFAIPQVADRSVDLFINENSLGVMSPQACRHFVEQICRCSNAFWHRNHEVRRNPMGEGVESLVNDEYPIPRDQFRQVVRDHDIARLIGHSQASEKTDMVWYYFERTRPSASEQRNERG